MTEHAPSSIVVGYDGSPHARAALEWAMDEARRRNAGVHIVHVWQFPGMALTSYGEATLPVIVPDDIEMAALDVERSARAVAAGIDPEIDVTASVERGQPADVLIRESKGAELVVVGTHGRGGFAGMLLGSVSARVASHAACPVVVIRGEDS